MIMRLRLKNHDLRELAQIYRVSANVDRQKAEEMRNNSAVDALIENAMRKSERAEKLERLAGVADEFLIAPATPFDGGPPSLMVVGGSDAGDGSAFVAKRAGRRRA
jgi:hypothetical protein